MTVQKQTSHRGITLDATMLDEHPPGPPHVSKAGIGINEYCTCRRISSPLLPRAILKVSRFVTRQVQNSTSSLPRLTALRGTQTDNRSLTQPCVPTILLHLAQVLV